jgi:hemerythrin-like domain-containing protein
MKPTEILENEHRVIEQVLDCLDAMVDESEKSGRVPEEPARQAIDFLRAFADRCHHGKEENQLFPMMEARGFSPHAGPTAVMRAEHVEGRTLIAAMEEAIPAASRGEGSACERWRTSARNYGFLLRQHIEKEDHCLFPMADQALGDADQTELLRLFDRVERNDIGAGVHERYLELADALAARYGVRRNRVTGQADGCGCSGHH